VIETERHRDNKELTGSSEREKKKETRKRQRRTKRHEDIGWKLRERQRE
jgi:hypothetical protein